MLDAFDAPDASDADAPDADPDDEPDAGFDEEPDEEPDDELEELLLYALSGTAFPCFCTHAVTSELRLSLPSLPPPPMPRPPSWM